MTAGRLAAVSPAATTDTSLYKANITDTASTVVNVCNQNSGASSYRLALRDYDQVLHLDGLNSSAYKFQRGNPVTSYYLNINPGFTDLDAVPGTNFTTTNGATATILDVFKPTTAVTYYTKISEIIQLSFAADSLTGTPVNGETITGATSGVTASNRGLIGAGTSAYIELADVATGSTTVNVDRNTGLADGMYLTVGDFANADSTNEILSIDASGINTTTNVLTVTRGALNTTPAPIPAGRLSVAWSASATVTTIDEGGTYAAGDVTLTVADSTGFVTGGYVLVDNEILEITGVAGNDLTVTRGSYGTSDVNHNNGATVTLLTNNGQYLLNWFTTDEALSFAGGAAATVSFSATSSQTISTKFVLSETGASATDHIFDQALQLDLNRTYIFDQSHSSNTNNAFRFSADDSEGPNGAGTEYTTGVTKVGTAGQAGCTVTINITSSTSNLLNVYSEDGLDPSQTGGRGFTVNVQLTPTYTRIYIYNVSGEALAAADTFTVGSTTQTIQASGVWSGPYGYVHDWDPATNHLKVSIDRNSAAFAVGNTFYDSPTLINGTRSLCEVVDGKILTVDTIGGADASRTAGTYTVSGSSNGSGTGQSFSVVVAASTGAASVTILNGGKNHSVGNTITILDSDLGGGGAANLTFNVATISSGIQTSATGVYNVSDYVFYDKAIAGNVTDKNSSIIVGPGQNLICRAANTNVSFIVNGFESNSSDYEVVNMTKSAGEGGGGGAAP